jgi:hypothetical protein
VSDRELFEALKRLLAVRVECRLVGETWPTGHVKVTLLLKDPGTGEEVRVCEAEDSLWALTN